MQRVAEVQAFLPLPSEVLIHTVFLFDEEYQLASYETWLYDTDRWWPLDVATTRWLFREHWSAIVGPWLYRDFIHYIYALEINIPIHALYLENQTIYLTDEEGLVDFFDRHCFADPIYIHLCCDEPYELLFKAMDWYNGLLFIEPEEQDVAWKITFSVNPQFRQ